MMGLVLSIAVLVTGTIVQNAEARGGPPDRDGKKTSLKFSCNDRKGVLNCKTTSRQLISPIYAIAPDGVKIIDHSADCLKNQPFGDDPILNGNYTVSMFECGTSQTWYYYNIHVVDKKIVSIDPIPKP